MNTNLERFDDYSKEDLEIEKMDYENMRDWEDLDISQVEILNDVVVYIEKLLEDK